jgi:hypothetical protein
VLKILPIHEVMVVSPDFVPETKVELAPETNPFRVPACKIMYLVLVVIFIYYYFYLLLLLLLLLLLITYFYLLTYLLTYLLITYLLLLLFITFITFTYYLLLLLLLFHSTNFTSSVFAINQLSDSAFAEIIHISLTLPNSSSFLPQCTYN